MLIKRLKERMSCLLAKLQTSRYTTMSDAGDHMDQKAHKSYSDRLFDENISAQSFHFTSDKIRKEM